MCAWVRCCGGGIKKNPVLFEDGAYADGITLIDCLWSTATPNFDGGRYTIANGKITMYGPNGAGCCGKYLSVDLANYVGKTLYFKISYNGGAETTKAFSIVSGSKRVIFGVGTPYESGYKYHFAVGISTDLTPQYITSNSDINDNYTASPASPLGTISKIWIE